MEILGLVGIKSAEKMQRIAGDALVPIPDAAQPDLPSRDWDEPCGCRICLQVRKEMVGGLPAEMTRMILCPLCGNKRCPHANNHEHACTNSNEPGQKGSAYE